MADELQDAIAKVSDLHDGDQFEVTEVEDVQVEEVVRRAQAGETGQPISSLGDRFGEEQLADARQDRELKQTYAKWLLRLMLRKECDGWRAHTETLEAQVAAVQPQGPYWPTGREPVGPPVGFSRPVSWCTLCGNGSGGHWPGCASAPRPTGIVN